MDKMNVTVKEFRVCYPDINLELQNNNPERYEMAIIAAHVAKLTSSFIVKKQYKTNKKGTKFAYKFCDDKKEGKKYIDKVESMIEEFNSKPYENKFNFNRGDL